MKKYSVRLQWSQTDWESILVHAESAEKAEKIAKEHFPGVHHISGVSELKWDIRE